MIKLWGGWAIDTDAYQFILGQPGTRKRKDEGEEPALFNTTFHKTLAQALQSFWRMQVRETINRNDLTLSQAIERALQIEERIRSLAAEPDFKEADQ
jgi:hypothetical protein